MSSTTSTACTSVVGEAERADGGEDRLAEPAADEGDADAGGAQPRERVGGAGRERRGVRGGERREVVAPGRTRASRSPYTASRATSPRIARSVISATAAAVSGPRRAASQSIPSTPQSVESTSTRTVW
jgi:hypothetical protein